MGHSHFLTLVMDLWMGAQLVALTSLENIPRHTHMPSSGWSEGDTVKEGTRPEVRVDGRQAWTLLALAHTRQKN